MAPLSWANLPGRMDVWMHACLGSGCGSACAGLVQVWMTSDNGRGWTAQPDLLKNTTCCTSSLRTCCPGLRILSVNCSAGSAKYLTGFNESTGFWGEQRRGLWLVGCGCRIHGACRGGGVTFSVVSACLPGCARRGRWWAGRGIYQAVAQAAALPYQLLQRKPAVALAAAHQYRGLCEGSPAQ